MSKLSVYNDNILLEIVKDEVKEINSILLPEPKITINYIVVSYGPKVTLPISIGGNLLCKTGHEFSHKNKMYLIASQDDVLLKIED